MMTVFVEGNPELEKPGADAARELADLRAASLSEAVDALLADRASTHDATAAAS
jgi:hypothetical protein